jgi:hypothetical protein
MNKWQIICPLAAMAIAAVVVLVGISASDFGEIRPGASFSSSVSGRSPNQAVGVAH